MKKTAKIAWGILILFVQCFDQQVFGQVTNPTNASTPAPEFLGWDNSGTLSKHLDIINGWPAKNITFQTGGTPATLRMLIDANGKIGMGPGGLFPCPTAPGWSLDVEGNINIHHRSFTDGFRIEDELMLHWTPTSDNLCLGFRSGENLNIHTGANTLIGTNTGRFMVGGTIAQGDDNTFVGWNAGEYNNGQMNTFIGSSAGASNTDGSFNSILGGWAGINLTTGDNNVFIGDYSGQLCTSNLNNVFVGANTANQLNMGGNFNCFFGANSGSMINESYNNTYVGYESGIMTIGNSNTFLGENTGRFLGGSRGNVFLGNNAGSAVPLFFSTSTVDNILIGRNAECAADLTNAIAIGADASVLTSNTLILGNNNVHVGIGLSGSTVAPSNSLEIKQGTPVNSGLTFHDLDNTFVPIPLWRKSS